MANFRKITEVPVLEELAGGEKVLLNVNGVAKQIDAEQLGGGGEGITADIEVGMAFCVEKYWEPEDEGYIYDITPLEGSEFTVNKTYAELKDKINSNKPITLNGGFKWCRYDCNDMVMRYPGVFDINSLFGQMSTIVSGDMIIDFEYLSELGKTREEFDAMSDNEELEFVNTDTGDLIYSAEKSDWWFLSSPFGNERSDEIQVDDFLEYVADDEIYYALINRINEEEEDEIYILVPVTKARFLSWVNKTKEEVLAMEDSDTLTGTIKITKKQLVDGLDIWFEREVGVKEFIEISNPSTSREGILELIGYGCGDEMTGLEVSMFLLPPEEGQSENTINVAFGPSIAISSFYTFNEIVGGY